MKKVYVIGDSISISYGPYLEKYLKGVMAYSRKEGVDKALQNLDAAMGANGGDSSNVLAFLEYKLNSGGIEADLMLFNCGLHDIKTDPATGKKQVPVEKYRENLNRIIEIAAKLKIEPVWIRTTPCDEKVHNKKNSSFYRFSADCNEYNAAADEIMRKRKVPVIDLYTLTFNLGSDIYCDHVHFNESIREKQGAFIAGWLYSWLERQDK
ncbi:MAG: SGNH/GDSL hydrolase family protein [Candidatus Omnitrophica bacterium]|nr:SGNH/GDSL hydrolase family protein [Candidatus Omnitrophota bacterium]